jgi:hypothetical protein
VKKLTTYQERIVQSSLSRYAIRLGKSGISLQVRQDFNGYMSIRLAEGDLHLNQAFDPQYVQLCADDFWLLAQNLDEEPIATYCLRRFLVDDFYDLVRSLTLWFTNRSELVDPRFAVKCEIPPFGGEIVHGGGLWIRSDYRGSSRLAQIMPRFARAVALRNRPFDHDSAMIRNDPRDRADVAERKAAYMGRRVYGFARVHRFADGWFPPEGREAVMHLCHATRAEAISSLLAPLYAAGKGLRRTQFNETPLVDQNNKPVHSPTVLSKWQEQASI